MKLDDDYDILNMSDEEIYELEKAMRACERDMKAQEHTSKRIIISVSFCVVAVLIVTIFVMIFRGCSSLSESESKPYYGTYQPVDSSPNAQITIGRNISMRGQTVEYTYDDYSQTIYLNEYNASFKLFNNFRILVMNGEEIHWTKFDFVDYGDGTIYLSCMRINANFKLTESLSAKSDGSYSYYHDNPYVARNGTYKYKEGFIKFSSDAIPDVYISADRTMYSSVWIKDYYNFWNDYSPPSKPTNPYLDDTQGSDTKPDCNYTLYGSQTVYTIKYGEKYSIQVPQKNGYAFLGWYYGDTQITNKYGEMLNGWSYTQQIELSPKYEMIQYKISYSANDGGTINGKSHVIYDCNVDNNFTAPSIMAVADRGYRFAKWSDGKISSTRQDTNVNSDMNIVADFIRVYEFTFTAGAGGTISGTTKQVIDIGKSTTAVTAVPKAGYEFVRWEYSPYGVSTYYLWTPTITVLSDDWGQLYGGEYVAVFKEIG